MVTVITEFDPKDERSEMELEDIFQKLMEETPGEAGYIAYEVLRTKITPGTYYIIEKWASERDLQNHAELVEKKRICSISSRSVKK